MGNKKVKIGLALGGGGAKGIAHLGILKVFEKNNISISSIVGTSAGAVVGGAYSLGLSPDEIVKRSKNIYSRKFLRISNFHLFNESLISAKDINKLIYELVGDKTFTDTKIPFEAIAVDLETGKEVILKEGKMWEALRASSAIPGIFSPIFVGERYLIDGGLLNDVPVDHLREQKDLDIIIGVDLGSLTSRQYISGMIWDRYYRKPKTLRLHPGFFTKLKINTNLMFHIMLRSLDIARKESQEIRFNAAKPDLVIRPRLDNISLLQFERFEEALAAGEKAGEAIMPSLLSLIHKKEA